jgi:hypothetical protein
LLRNIHYSGRRPRDNIMATEQSIAEEQVLKLVTILALLTTENDVQRTREILNSWIGEDADLRGAVYNFLDEKQEQIAEYVGKLAQGVNIERELKEAAGNLVQRLL